MLDPEEKNRKLRRGGLGDQVCCKMRAIVSDSERTRLRKNENEE